MMYQSQSQKAALVNCLKSFRNFIRTFRSQGFGLFVAAGHVNNGERVSENFALAVQFVVRHKKKVDNYSRRYRTSKKPNEKPS